MSNKNKGLGRGINALFPEDEFSDETLQGVPNSNQKNTVENILSNQNISLSQIQEIPITEIRPNPYQPRVEFDATALEELAHSIRQQGVLQPVILRKSAIKGYEIVSGERRTRAAEQAGRKTIPAIVRQMTDDEMIEIAIVENLQREDLTPLEEAQAYQNLMTMLRLTQAQVAERIGKSRSYIANFLRLLDLNEDVKKWLQLGELSMGQARTLLGLKNKKEQSHLAKKVIEEGITVRQLEKMVQALNEPAPKVSQKKLPQKSGYIRESEDLLMNKFGVTVQIKEKGKKGKIEIEYLSQEELTRILDILDIHFKD